MLRATVLFALICTLTLHAAYPDSLEVEVTLYDFHSDGSNPDFNPGADDNDVTPNLVKEKLSQEGIPQSTNKCLYSYDISRWFRKNEAGSYNTIPHYTWQGGISWIDTLNSTEQKNDSSYVNLEIDTTLTFYHKGSGIYAFESSNFFPLDGKGYGSESTINWDGTIATPHNYSFTMKLERDFIYQKGLSFEFKGDDDVWVFIDGKLALDLGGCHPEQGGSFDLDAHADSFNLIEGENYTLSFFFAERQADGSNCKITSNIISAPPTNLLISVSPSDTVIAGDTLTLEALIDSDTGLVDNIEGTIHWSFTDMYDINHDSVLTPSGAKEALLSPTKAHTTLQVTASYTEKSSNLTFSDTATVYVIPNRPEILTIETKGQKPSAGSNRLWYTSKVDTIHIDKGSEFQEEFFAIYRDRYANWIGPYKSATNNNWSTLDTLLATAEKGSETKLGEGRACRNQSILGGTTILTLHNDDTLTDSATLILDKMYYIECIPLPTPFSVDSQITLPGLEDRTGVAFTFPFIGTCNEFAFATSIHIDIFDNIGNLIHSINATDDEILMFYDLDAEFASKHVDALAAVTWDGRNRNNRKISTGTYIAIVTFTDNGGTRFRQTTPISITK